VSRGDFSIRYDPDKLRAMIAQGLSAKEIMKALKISRYTLREHLMMLQEKDKKLYVIKGLFENPEAEDKIIRKEGIIFSKEMLEKSGLHTGDVLEMIIEKGRIILKKRKRIASDFSFNLAGFFRARDPKTYLAVTLDGKTVTIGIETSQVVVRLYPGEVNHDGRSENHQA